ncbi:sugar phosphate isomerase/epimerase family protein [Nocardia asiatica]|uniref:sugar phosphate isomerase/epimerase family protein n=1 Tax=Nocardia asiatica TaxID=209252 RepID=UPI003EDE83A4
MLATCWTSAGNVRPGPFTRSSPLPLLERIEAVAEAGFRGFGLHSVDLDAAVGRYGLKGIRNLLETHGIEDVELEAIPGWWSEDSESHSIRRRVLEAAEALGARHIKVTPDEHGGTWDLSLWSRRFAALAAQAEDVGARLGIEFLPWSNIKDLAAGLRFVEEAGHTNGGVVLDIWHLERNNTPAAAILEVPLDRITGVELNDAAADVVGSLFDDTIDRRRYCGEGDFGLGDFIGALRTVGWSGPWGIEILSTEHRAAPVRAALLEAGATAGVLLSKYSRT